MFCFPFSIQSGRARMAGGERRLVSQRNLVDLHWKGLQDDVRWRRSCHVPGQPVDHAMCRFEFLNM